MRQLVNWFRRKQMERDLDRELQYHLDRRITDFKLVADRFHIRFPLLAALFSQDAFVYHHRGALAHAGHWSCHSDLLAGGSGVAALASGPPAGTACPDRLERRLGREWLRQFESDVLSHLPRS